MMKYPWKNCMFLSRNCLAAVWLCTRQLSKWRKRVRSTITTLEETSRSKVMRVPMETREVWQWNNYSSWTGHQADSGGPSEDANRWALEGRSHNAWCMYHLWHRKQRAKGCLEINGELKNSQESSNLFFSMVNLTLWYVWVQIWHDHKSDSSGNK